jgi:hypothetical protein
MRLDTRLYRKAVTDHRDLETQGMTKRKGVVCGPSPIQDGVQRNCGIPSAVMAEGN